ncbi:sec-independent protein translocase protein TatB [Bartonella silvatica]|uniref:Sec-independent protein translocase protein TatB n=1 Tax=Bartonella silvatica TaxID=357760 RepID=A0ABV2HHG4_9HYPH
MFGINGPEFFVILIVLIVVVGPRDLPKVLKAIERAMAYVRSTANEFRHQFNDAMRQAELDDLQKTLSDINDLNLTKELKETFDSINGGAEDIRDSFDEKTVYYKSKKDKETFGCDQDKVNEDLTVSVNRSDSEGEAVIFKDKKGTS